MIKKVLQLLLHSILIFTLIVPYFLPLTVLANNGKTIQDMKTDLANLRTEKSKIDNSAALTRDEINKAQTQVNNAQTEQRKIETEITKAEEEIVKSEELIDQLIIEIEALLRYEQLTRGDDIFSEYLAAANNLSDLIRRLAAVEQITNYSQNKLDELNELIEHNKQLKIDLADKSEELDSKIAEIAKLIDSLNGELMSYSHVNATIEEQIDNQIKQIEYYQGICSSETIPVTSCSEFVESFGWRKPTVSGKVTSVWGNRSGGFHYGVDIGGNREGTPIYAVAEGRVSFVVRYNCGGNTVYIHSIVNGQRYTIEYAHMLLTSVSIGQTVSTDTQVGKVGGGASTPWDQCSSGPHLHLGVSEGFYGVDYSSWGSFLANNVEPPGFPNYGYTWSYR